MTYTTSTEPATVLQNNYIDKLREDKAWRMELTPNLDHGQAFYEAQLAGRAAFEADLTDLTKAQASALIDALKAW